MDVWNDNYGRPARESGWSRASRETYSRSHARPRAQFRAMQAGAAVLAAVVLAAAAALSGCAVLSEEHAVQLELPPLPESWQAFGEVRAAIEYRAADGSEATLTVPWNPGEPVTLWIPKEQVTVVTATPRAPLPDSDGEQRREPSIGLLPAAAFYPFSLTQYPLLRAEWSSGAAAAELSRIAEAYGWEWFNIGRVLEELRHSYTRSPWWLDWQRIREQLWEESFRSSYLSERGTLAVALELPEGEWISADPFLPLLSIGLELPVGAHRYYQPASRRRFDIYVDERGETTTMLRSY